MTRSVIATGRVLPAAQPLRLSLWCLRLFQPVFAALLVVAAPARLAAAEDQPLKREQHTPETHLRFAEGLMARKFYDFAETELRGFLQKFPDHQLAPVAMFRLVECLRAKDDVPGTISVISQFQARWPSHEFTPNLYLVKGELLFRMNELEQAQSCFRQLTVSQDSVAREAALYFLAQCQAKEGKVDLALEAYTKLAAEPFDGKHQYRPYALFALAAALQHKGDHAKAEESYQRLVTQANVPPGVREEALYRLGETAFLRGDYGRAIEQYERLLVEFPDGTFAREARKRRAWASYSAQDYAKAVELGRDWLKRYNDNDDYEMNYLLAASLVAVDQHKDALPLFQRTMLNLQAPEEYRRLARYNEIQCLLRLDRHQEALGTVTRYLDDFPKGASRPDVLFFGAEAHFGLGDYDKAIAGLRQALETGGAGDWRYFLDANLRLADCLDRQKKHKEAAAVLRPLVSDKRVADKALFLLRAGEMERKAQDLDAAIKDFELILKEHAAAPEAGFAILHLAELYAAKEDYVRAENLLRELLKSSQQKPSEAKLQFFLGYLLHQQGKQEEAEKLLRQALAASGEEETTRTTKYYLAAVLLELKRDDEALNLFAELLALPQDKRPAFSESLLLRVEKLYFARNRFDASENICRWLLQAKDPETVVRATLRLSQVMVAQNRTEEARQLLEKLLTAKEAEDPKAPLCAVISSYLGEVYLQAGLYDQAVSALERALGQPTAITQEDAARARWGLADILYREKRLDQALHHSVNAFVLCDDPIYTPRAMLTAILIFLDRQEVEKARTTWKELKIRYASFAEQKRTDPVLKERLPQLEPPPAPGAGAPAAGAATPGGAAPAPQ